MEKKVFQIKQINKWITYIFISMNIKIEQKIKK